MLNKILILLNDADPVLARVCRNKFEKQEGWESTITTSFEEALATTQSSHSDIILTDIILNSGGKSGFDLIEAIRHDDKNPNNKTPIVVFTKLHQDSDKQKAMELGANYYFVKSEMSILEVITELKQLITAQLKTQ